jgi:O-antigen/teichoic acid export membrane protein
VANELKNKFFYQTIISVTQVLLPLISYPYITRILGPANLGRINYVDFLSQMFMIFAVFGIPFYGMREIARVRNDMEGRSVLLKELTLLLALFSITAIIIFSLLAYFDKSSNLLLYLFAALNILLGAFSFDWYIQGTEAFRFAAIRSVLIRLGMLLSFFIFVKSSDDYIIYFGIFTAGFILISGTNISKVLSENTFVKQPINIKQHLKPLWHFFLTSSAISIYIYFDAILLQQITRNEAAVGQYTLVLKMIKICQVALLSIGVVMMPRLSPTI